MLTEFKGGFTFMPKKSEEIEYPLESLPDSLPDEIDPEQYIIGTYYVGLPVGIPVKDVAEAAALEQSTGTWTLVPGETPEMRKKYVAKVTGIYEGPYPEYSEPRDSTHRHYIIQVAFPWINFGQQIPMLWSTVVGNISMGGRVKLLDLSFPKSWLKAFKGPKFGIKGVFKVLGVKDRPLLNNMIKPCTGYTPQQGAKLLYEAARGGADVIKDDELIADPVFNRIVDRQPLYMEAVDKANSEKGEKTLYTVNITDSIPKVMDNAQAAIDHGANALMINYLAVGYDAARWIAEDPSIKVPILGHMDIAGALSYSPTTGVSTPLVIGKFPRICGMDIEVFPAPYGKAPMLKERYKDMARSMIMPLQHIKPMLPMPSGGITPGHVPQVIEDLGTEIMIGSGGGIHAFPAEHGGPAAGARAFRQAITACMQGTPLEEYAQDHKELKVALEKWGGGKTGFEM